jgi:APA family basic amino acid/polyamine antiporter
MIVMGGIIGSGIFINPYVVASEVESAGLILLAWAAGGAIALLGAFVYAELASLRPEAGGQYAYLRDAYHPAVAFLYGWALLLVVQSGGMAAVAVTFARYARELTGSAFSDAVLASVTLLVLTAVNIAGVRSGSNVQTALMLLKLAAIIALIVAGLTWSRPEVAVAVAAAPKTTSILSFLAALTPVMFAYGGWQTSSFIAAELKRPRRDLVIGLLAGVIGVIAVYLGVNAAALRVLGASGLAATTTPASTVMQTVYGPAGARVIALGIAVSTLGFLAQGMLTAPRVYYAMAGDGLFFRAVGRVHPRTRTPHYAIALQGAVAIAIALSGTYEQILSYVVATDFIFFGLTGAALFVFRRRGADGDAFRTPGHPVTTAIFTLACWTVVAATIVRAPADSAVGLAIVLSGIVAYFIWRRRSMRKLFAVLFLAVPLTALAQASDAERFRPFEEFAQRQMARDKTVGLSVAVLDGDQMWARGFGHADLENEVRATERTSYRMASVSKPMTAVAALKLAESGKLDLDADVRRYVPYFPDKGKTITIRQLLAHLGGVSHYRNYLAEGMIREPKNTKEAIEIFANFDLVSTPGAEHHYSTYGYNLAGAAIEGATGRSYGEVMRELVWEPAGMTSTRLDSPVDLIPFRATGYRLQGGQIRRSDYVDISSRFGGGGARSTVVDMVRFARALYDGRLLGPQSLEAMWAPALTTSNRFVNYGLGWNVSPVNGHFFVSHGGSQQEARTLLMVWPQRKLAIAFASNFEDVDFGPYRVFLHSLVTGEVWGPAPYAGDPHDRLAIEIAGRLIDAGGFHFEKHGRPLTTDQRRLRKAFQYINDLYRRAAGNPAAAQEAIAEALQPSADQATAVAGSWITSTIAAAGADRAALAREGPLAAVARYVATGSRPRLDAALAKRIVELSKGWQSVWTEEAKQLLIDPPPHDQFTRAVAQYRGLRIAPNHAGRLVEEVESAFGRGDLASAEQIATLASGIYPHDHAAAGVYGILLAVQGRAQDAETWLRRSAQSDARGYASAPRLANAARDLNRRKQTGAARTLLEVALRVHPTSDDLIKAKSDLAK